MDIASNYTETLEKTIRDLLERQDDLIRTAFTDELTGLGNRGGFTRYTPTPPWAKPPIA